MAKIEIEYNSEEYKAQEAFDIAASKWSWYINDHDKTTSVIGHFPDPAKCTVSFNADGTIKIKIEKAVEENYKPKKERKRKVLNQIKKRNSRRNKLKVNSAGRIEEFFKSFGFDAYIGTKERVGPFGSGCCEFNHIVSGTHWKICGEGLAQIQSPFDIIIIQRYDNDHNGSKDMADMKWEYNSLDSLVNQHPELFPNWEEHWIIPEAR